APALIVAGLAASTAGASAAPSSTGALHAKRVCGAPMAGHAACFSEVLVNRHNRVPYSSSPPSGALKPVQLVAAYNLPSSPATGTPTVAIVDAYGYPNLASDLATYRSYFKLPSCTEASGCLTVMSQSGSTTNLPKMNLGWAQEQALDVDTVSAACPTCHILVVEASSSSFANLGTAVVTASKQAGVVAISNSYGGSDAPDSTYGHYYKHPGIAVTASAGDSGYSGASYPASSAYVVAAGGTSLTMNGTSRVSETVWSGTGSGCSSYNAALAAAASFGTQCSGRAMNDVSAAADPANGGMAVYWPSSRRNSTWAQVGGTSESSPIIASVFALSGKTGSTSEFANAIPYGAWPSGLHDITSGNNGSCSPTVWCKAGSGWDGPTGLGTPNGVSAF
ncbi:MAG TPA: hypothetical protein VFI30_05430, partial [Nocardioidaceae bacterium]|nr:hypothetical protein [Nocardioidaceae bacterium]